MCQPLRDEEHRLNRDEALRRLQLWQDRLATEQRSLAPVRERMAAIRQFVEEYHALRQRERSIEGSLAMADTRVRLLENLLARGEAETK